MLPCLCAHSVGLHLYLLVHVYSQDLDASHHMDSTESDPNKSQVEAHRQMDREVLGLV